MVNSRSTRGEEKHTFKTSACKGQSEDGGVGRRGVWVSPQLGHLLDAGGGPRCPRRWEEPPSNQVGGGTEVGGEVEARQDRHL